MEILQQYDYSEMVTAISEHEYIIRTIIDVLLLTLITRDIKVNTCSDNMNACPDSDRHIFLCSLDQL